MSASVPNDPDIFYLAFHLYGYGGYDFGLPKEGAANGTADTDKPKNNLLDIDCIHLVNNVLERLGYHKVTGRPLVDFYYFQVPTWDQLAPGDLLVFAPTTGPEPRHIGIVETKVSITIGGKATWTGMFFHSNFGSAPSDPGGPRESQWLDDRTGNYLFGGSACPIVLRLRPKARVPHR